MLEKIVVVLSLLYLVLIMMEKRVGWIFGTVGSVLFVVSNVKQHLYMDCVLNSYYTIVGIYGWWVWGEDNKSDSMPVRNINTRLLVMLLLVVGILILSLGTLMGRYTNNTLPYLDTAVTVLSVLATWMAARKYMENWILWLVADPLAIWLYSVKYYPTDNWWLYPALFLMYTIMAAYGYLLWKKDLKYDA